ncbi:MAG: hypothetical protein HRU70_05415 [Phycisphaeraceae bacterium]|nr:MAG: hypothetical protein HRU70_05415 [Phycisphaeraceae bacterium]
MVPDPDTSNFTRARSWRVLRRALTAASLAFIAVLVLIAWRAYALSRRTPEWYNPPDPAAVAVADRAAELERRVVDQAHLVRGGSRRHSTAASIANPALDTADGEWEVSIPQDAVNAWLASRFPLWLANQDPPIELPDNLGALQVRFLPGSATLGVHVRRSDPNAATPGPVSWQFVGVTFEPSIGPDGGVWLPASSMHVGDLRLPTAWVLERFASQARVEVTTEGDEAVAALLGAFLGKRALATPAAIELADGRVLRVLDLRVAEGALEVRCRTEGRSISPK